jgi:hypothetical protein
MEHRVGLEPTKSEGAAPEERCTLEHYIKTELAQLVTVRDVAEMDARLPGFAEAMHGGWWSCANRTRACGCYVLPGRSRGSGFQGWMVVL